ncbi:MAG: hypothetical protein P4L10_14605 [Acidobacteriaceae bacterium]|nr:hypothetical protein [Acidobacteriaceae bacterium]
MASSKINQSLEDIIKEGKAEKKKAAVQKRPTQKKMQGKKGLRRVGDKPRRAVVGGRQRDIAREKGRRGPNVRPHVKLHSKPVTVRLKVTSPAENLL